LYLTRQKKEFIISILTTWEREDDADDYFEMWKKHFDANQNSIFIILNYNLLTELQKIKYFIFESKSISVYSFKHIMKFIESYSFLSLLAETINSEDIDDNEKKNYFIKILKNLINTYILLTKNLFNPSIFPQIGKTSCLYRSWRSIKQLNLMKTVNNQPNNILITDNFLSTSLDKELALRFYRTSSAGILNFVLWEIEIPAEYPNLYVSTELNEVLLHIGAKLQFISSENQSMKIGGYPEIYNITFVRYKYIGYDKLIIDQVLDKFKKGIKILEQVSGHAHPPVRQTSVFKKNYIKNSKRKLKY
tara:strand:- start:2186 stop:3100 length:915 start_codon:yes stop_codon:yes gene_type:complete